LLSIFLIHSAPHAAAKYQQTKKIAGYPAPEIGNTQTGVLVGGRYQVKAILAIPPLPSDRAAWLEDLISMAWLD